jgi:hypothetical protein
MTKIKSMALANNSFESDVGSAVAPPTPLKLVMHLG